MRTTWAVVLTVVLAGAWSAAPAADFYWDGEGANNDDNTAANWVGDVAPGDNAANAHMFRGTPAQFSINYSGATTTNDLLYFVFGDANSALDLTAKFTVTGSPRTNSNSAVNLYQNSAQEVEMNVTTWGNEPEIAGTGSGLLTISGTVARGQGQQAVTSTINNAGFDVLWSGTLVRGNDDWNIIKQGAGKLTVSGTWATDTTDPMGDPMTLDVQAGTVEITGTMGSSNVSVNGGTFKGGSGTVWYNINGAVSDLMDLNSGTLNISTLTIDFQVGAGGVTEMEYVLVDYSTGGTLITATNLGTGNTFGGVANLPSVYSIVNDTVNRKILLVPEPATMALLLLGAAGVMLKRNRRRS